MARLFTQNISDTECIGDSLDTINNNSENLDTAIQSLSGKVRTLTLSPDNIFYINSSTTSASWRGTVLVSGGNDSNGDGSTATPFRTLSACAEYIYNTKDLGGGGIRIRLCPGSYKGIFFRGPGVGATTTTPSFNSAFPGIEIPTATSYITIEGSNKADTFINQYKEGTFWSGSGINWRHLHFERVGASVNNVTFRYNSAVDPIEGSASSLRVYNMLVGNAGSNINVSDTVFESAPDILAGVQGQPTSNFTTPELILIVGRSALSMSNITIDNQINGSANSAANATGRMFLNLSDYSLAYLGGTFTLLNNPRFNAIFYLGAYCRVIQDPANFWVGTPISLKFSWVGTFGTRVGTNTNEGFTINNWRKSNIGNYLIYNDQYSEAFITAAIPGNALARSRSTASDASIFSRYVTW